MRRVRFAYPLSLFLLVAAGMASVVVHTRGSAGTPAAAHVVYPAVGLAERGVLALRDALREWTARHGDAERLHRENTGLRRQLAAREVEVYQLRETARRFSQTMPEVDYARRLAMRTLHAPVLGVSWSGLRRVLRIGRGANDNVRPEQAVLTRAGLVGIVESVLPNEAVVRMIIDPRSAVDVRVADTRARGIAYGSGDEGRVNLHIRFLEYGDEVALDRLVVTGGAARTYPPGIPVGHVGVVTPGESELTVHVRPSVEFDRLDDVLVVIHSDW